MLNFVLREGVLHKSKITHYRIGAIFTDTFPPLGQSSGRADKVVSFRTILYHVVCAGLHSTRGYVPGSMPIHIYEPIPDIHHLLGSHFTRKSSSTVLAS
jgi:hypothetical protein